MFSTIKGCTKVCHNQLVEIIQCRVIGEIMQGCVFPPIPVDTNTRALSAFNPNHFYMRFGRDVAELMEGIDFCLPQISTHSFGVSIQQVALIMIFQFREKLPDFQASEAVRIRTDWKYALHLPITYAEVRPAALCFGRCTFLLNSEGRQVFQALLDRLIEFDYLRDLEAEDEKLTAETVLRSICTINRLHEVRHAMSDVLVNIVVSQPNWLRDHMLPHWFNKYGKQAGPIPDMQIEQIGYAQAIGRDIHYLLTQIGADRSIGPPGHQEVQALKTAWQQNYEPCNLADEDFRWRETGCANCPRSSVGIKIS